jgi:hypothetical protein
MIDERYSTRPGSAPASEADAEWWFIHYGMQLGPFSLGRLVELALVGRIEADDMVRQGNGFWTKAREVPCLQGHFFLQASKERTVARNDLLPGAAFLLAHGRAIGIAAAILVALCVGIIGCVNASRDLTGTTWNGAENLEGFGDLKFEFRQKGNVVMTDAMYRVKGTVAGKWERTGSNVTITFLNCDYRGVVNGSVLSGTAYSAQFGKAWTFSVRMN